MAVIDITSSTAVKLTQGRIGFGYNPEMQLVINAALFDQTVAPDDVVVYRIYPNTVIYKGIVRKIGRSLQGEQVNLTVAAAETVLEGKKWTPTLAAYNKEIICPQRMLNATIGDIIRKEFTEHEPPAGEEGPKDWFTEIELPESIADLIAAPVETYQASFLSIIESAIAIYPHVRWFIEYAPASTAVLPLGKLVLVDTGVGRSSKVLTVGGNVLTSDLSEDYSACAGELRVYGGGDFVERDEILTPMWKPEDETLERDLVIPAPTAFDIDSLTGTIAATYIPWGYDLAGLRYAYYSPKNGGPQVRIYQGRDFWLDPNKGILFWNQYNGSIKKDGSGQIISGAPPDGSYRRLAVYETDFYGSEVTLGIVYSGPDCYRLYSVSEPIANLRYRITKVADPDKVNDLIDQPVEQGTILEAFVPVPVGDTTKYVSDPDHYKLAKVLIPTDTGIYWDERNPNIASSKGFSLPTDTPEFEPGRKCVRFERRQLLAVVPFITEITPDMQNVTETIWLTWQIKCRYTAWRNLLQTRTGVAGVNYIGRFVFDELRKYTMFNGSVLMDRSAELDDVADKVENFYGQVKWSGNVTVSCALQESGGHKTATLTYGVGDAVTLTGAVDSGLAASFIGIINDIDLTGLESGVGALTIGVREPDRNPFAPKPPEFVDQEAATRLVYDRSVFDRRSI